MTPQISGIVQGTSSPEMELLDFGDWKKLEKMKNMKFWLAQARFAILACDRCFGQSNPNPYPALIWEYAFLVMRFVPRLLLATTLSVFAAAQTTAPAQPVTSLSTPASTTSGDVGMVLARIEQETQGLNLDLSNLRIDKWKADSQVKQQATENAASIRRNITAALPEVIGAVRSAPQSLAANFKLYRNLNALYDVVSNLAESAGAFGKRDEYATIAPHVAALDEVRHSYTDLLQQMTANADDRMAAAQRAQAAAATQPPPKKIIVDDTEPSAPTKKKKTKKSAPSSSSAGTSTPQ